MIGIEKYYNTMTPAEIEREWTDDPVLAEIDRKNTALARRLIEDVGLPITSKHSLRDIGFLITALAYQARDIDAPRHEPTKVEAMKSANDAVIKMQKAIMSLRNFQSLGEATSVFWRETNPAITEMERTISFLKNEFAKEWDDLQPNVEDELDRLKEKFPDEFEKDYPDGATTSDFILVNSLEDFVGVTLKLVYREIFGRDPSHTKNRNKDEAEGKFIKFTRMILNEAGIDLASNSIARYMYKGRKTNPSRK